MAGAWATCCRGLSSLWGGVCGATLGVHLGNLLGYLYPLTLVLYGAGVEAQRLDNVLFCRVFIFLSKGE